MSTWEKENIFIRLLVPVTGAEDTASYTVKFQPVDQAYPTGAVSGTQCSTDKSLWQPASDLDTEKHYDIYIDGVKKGRITSPDSYPSIGV